MTLKNIIELYENKVDDKYTLSNKLWQGHKRRLKEHRAKGNGFGYSLFDGNSKYTSTISARYYKDGSEILIQQKDKKSAITSIEVTSENELFSKISLYIT